MKPQKAVIAVSYRGSCAPRALTLVGELSFANDALPTRADATSSNKFDYSDEELDAILAWLLTARAA